MQTLLRAVPATAKRLPPDSPAAAWAASRAPRRPAACWCALRLAGTAGLATAGAVTLPAAQTPEGYVCRLLINESPFPGEKGYRSEADTIAGMNSLLHVLEGRLRRVPPPYTQQNIAACTTHSIFDIITASDTCRQFEGFYRDAAGRPTMAPRVTERIRNLLTIAGQGQPGRFARLLNHAVKISTQQAQDRFAEPNPHALVQRVGAIPVTGGAFSWMTDEARFKPGGNFVRLPDADHGGLGGNRFFTLRKAPK